MSVATSTAIAIATVTASTVATVEAARTQANANKQAAQTNAQGNDTAAQINADAATKDLAQAKTIYDQTRADEAPYRALGQGALATLGQHGFYIPAPAPAAPPAMVPTATMMAGSSPATAISAATTAAQGASGPTVPRLSTTPTTATSTLNSLGSDPLVNMISPQGQPGQVPQSKVQQAIAAGGRLA